MGRIPCRVCPKCGLYHDFTVTVCPKCGRSLSGIAVKAPGEDEIPPEKRGEIHGSLTVYTRTCPRCESVNYLPEPELPAGALCEYCHKPDIRRVKSVPFPAQGEPQRPAPVQESAPPAAPRAPAKDEPEEELDDGTLFWLKLTKANIGAAVAGQGAELSPPPEQKSAQTKPPAHGSASAEDDGDDEDFVDWTIPGHSPEPKKPEPKGRNIRFTALRYGQRSFTLQAAEGASHLLGRYAEQGDFLERDGRVSGEHCYIEYRAGRWYVRDNHSKNGTAVNGRDIGLGGETPLSHADTLILGHKPDSMAFRAELV